MAWFLEDTANKLPLKLSDFNAICTATQLTSRNNSCACAHFYYILLYNGKSKTAHKSHLVQCFISSTHSQLYRQGYCRHKRRQLVRFTSFTVPTVFNLVGTSQTRSWFATSIFLIPSTTKSIIVCLVCSCLPRDS